MRGEARNQEFGGLSVGRGKGLALTQLAGFQVECGMSGWVDRCGVRWHGLGAGDCLGPGLMTLAPL